MKKTLLCISLLISFIIMLTSCKENASSTNINFDENKSMLKITDGGEYTLSGTLKNATFEIDTQDEVRIILDGVTIENEKDEAIKIENSKNTVFIINKGTKNYITGAGDAAINAKSSIELHSEGYLFINGLEKHAVECDGSITINGGAFEINSYEHGVKSEAVIKIMGGDIDIVSETGKGIKAEKEYIGDGGNIIIYSKADEGLESKGALTINGGNYDITSYDDAINAGTSDTATEVENTENIPMPEDFNGEMPPNGYIPENVPTEDEKVITVPEGATTSGRGIPFEHEKSRGGFGKVNADSVLTINGGTIKINTFGEGDGIDSNGTLSINGGTVIIDGPKQKDNGSLDSDGEMTIENATVLCASSNGMTQYPRSMTQASLIIDFENALEKDVKIRITDADGNIITEHTVGVICERFYFTSPDIGENTEYTVYINGEEHSKVTSSKQIDSFRPMKRPDRASENEPASHAAPENS